MTISNWRRVSFIRFYVAMACLSTVMLVIFGIFGNNPSSILGWAVLIAIDVIMLIINIRAKQREDRQQPKLDVFVFAKGYGEKDEV